MNTVETIYKRRSIRKYKDEKIDDAILKEILDAGTWAPSGVNLQPWYFVAVRSEDKLEKLTQIMGTVSKRIEPDLQARFSKHPAVVDETTKFIRRMGGAPVCILVFRLKPDYNDAADMVNLSIAAAMENILLAAADKGIGTCWLTAPVEAETGEEIRNLFAPGKGPMVAMITMGYPAEDAAEPKAPARKSGRYDIL